MTTSVIAKLKLLEVKQLQCEQALMKLAQQAKAMFKRQKNLCADTKAGSAHKQNGVHGGSIIDPTPMGTERIVSLVER